MANINGILWYGNFYLVLFYNGVYWFGHKIKLDIHYLLLFFECYSPAQKVCNHRRHHSRQKMTAKSRRLATDATGCLAASHWRLKPPGGTDATKSRRRRLALSCCCKLFELDCRFNVFLQCIWFLLQLQLHLYVFFLGFVCNFITTRISFTSLHCFLSGGN